MGEWAQLRSPSMATDSAASRPDRAGPDSKRLRTRIGARQRAAFSRSGSMPVSSARVAASTSSLRIRASPTRKVSMPTTRQPHAIGVTRDAAFADNTRSCGNEARESFADLQRRVESVQVAVVDADQAALRAPARARARLRRWTSTRTSRPRSWAVLLRVRAVSSSTAARIIRMQSAPQARASST